jgi:AcrR family transcriptional regulator
MAPPATATRIVRAARRLLEKQGPDAVSMRRVASAVGITAMAIYRHYPDRAALLEAVADRGFEELAASLAGRRFTGSLEDRLLAMTDLYLDHALANPRLFELMFLRPRAGARVYPRDFKARRSPTATLLADALAEGMACGVLAADDHWEVCFGMGALSHGLILLYLGGRLETTPAGLRALHRRTFRRYLDGIRAR